MSKIPSSSTKMVRVNGKLHCTDGPAVERTNGHREWWVEGKRHRTDGPAIEFKHGSKHWYVDGKRHRTDGPAIERIDSDKVWYVNGVKCNSSKEFKLAAKITDEEMAKVILKHGNVEE